MMAALADLTRRKSDSLSSEVKNTPKQVADLIYGKIDTALTLESVESLKTSFYQDFEKAFTVYHQLKETTLAKSKLENVKNKISALDTLSKTRAEKIIQHEIEMLN